MKKIFGARKAITVSLEEADYKWVELQAGGNVSGWARDRILSGKKKSEIATVSNYKTRKLPAGTGLGDISELIPSPNVCANCEHPKSKHGGFGTCCQADCCACPRFE